MLVSGSDYLMAHKEQNQTPESSKPYLSHTDHVDHTRGVARLAHRLQLPIYASPEAVSPVKNVPSMSAELSAYIKVTRWVIKWKLEG